MDNSCTRITGEESEHPPLTSCSQIALLEEQKKRTIHLLQKRTFLFTLDTNFWINYSESYKKRQEMIKEKVSQRVNGLRIGGEIYLPQAKQEEHYPAICLCHGIPGRIKDPTDRGYQLLAERFCMEDLAVLIVNRLLPKRKSL